MNETEHQLQDACMNGVINVDCPQCGTVLSCEPDAESTYCGECDKVVTPTNSLVAKGLM